MAEVKFVINGKEFPVNYVFLKEISQHLPDTPAYKPLAQELLNLAIPSISQDVMEQVSLNEAQLDQLWEQGDKSLRTALLENDEFIGHLTDAQAQDILDSGNQQWLVNIASHADTLYPDDDGNGMRLSGGMADQLMEKILSMPDPRVKRALVRNHSTPLKFMPKFQEIVDLDLKYMPSQMLENMTLADVANIEKMSRKLLCEIAESLEDIEDKEVQEKVGEILVNWPDPEVRQALAENDWAPNAFLSRLLSDPDADIRDAAKKSLDD